MMMKKTFYPAVVTAALWLAVSAPASAFTPGPGAGNVLLGDRIAIGWSFPGSVYDPVTSYPDGIGGSGATTRPALEDPTPNQPIGIGQEEFGNPLYGTALDTMSFKNLSQASVTVGSGVGPSFGGTDPIAYDMRIIFDAPLQRLALGASTTVGIIEAESFLDLFTKALEPGWGIALDATAATQGQVTLSRNNSGVYSLGAAIRGKLFTSDSTPTPNNQGDGSGQGLPFGLYADPLGELEFTFSFGNGQDQSDLNNVLIAGDLGRTTGFTGTGEVFFDQGEKMPVPATLVLMGLGLVGLGFARRKQG
jgi:hypothetical protein